LERILLTSDVGTILALIAPSPLEENVKEINYRFHICLNLWTSTRLILVRTSVTHGLILTTISYTIFKY
jgi:hypothetical protein